MMRKANKTVIGAFVVGAIALLLIGIVSFGSGAIFRRTNKYVLFFDGSIKGLSVGAPVIFRGVKVGTVKEITLVYDSAADAVIIPVIIEVEPARIKGTPKKWGYKEYGTLIQSGLQAKLEVQSFITGQLMISFDFYPDRPVKLRGLITKYPELPTLPTSPDIFEIMDEIPLKEISKNLDATVAGLNKLVNSEELQGILYGLRVALGELTQTTRSLRLLVEYLEQHPEAFLKGKPVLKGEIK